MGLLLILIAIGAFVAARYTGRKAIRWVGYGSIAVLVVLVAVSLTASVSVGPG